jgi:hypothetical protein
MIYADYSMVALLLDRSLPGRTRALSVAAHLWDRLTDVRSLEGVTVDWDAFHSNLRRATWDHVPGATDRADGPPMAIRDNEDAVRRGVQLRRALIDEVLAPVHEHPELEIFPRDFFSNVLRERPLMWLSSTEGRWIKTAANVGRVEVGGEVFCDKLRLRHATDDNLDQLRLDLYLDLYERYAFTTLASDQGVFGVTSTYDLDPGFADELLRTRLDREQILAVTRIFRSGLPEYTKSTNFDTVLEDLWTSGARELLLETYSSVAFAGERAAHDCIAETGVSALMNDEARLVRGLAAATLGASARMSPEAVEELGDFDVRRALRRAAASWPFAQLPLASVDTDGFLDSVF